MLVESQKVIDLIEKRKGYGINGILEQIVDDIDDLCSDWEKMGLNIEPKKNCNNCKYGYLSSVCKKPTNEICGNNFSQWKPYKALEQEPKIKETGLWERVVIALPLSDGVKECYSCSNCATHWDFKTNFCPNCGAKMESEE